MILFGKLALLTLSYLGYWEHLHIRYRVNPFYAPLLTLGCHFFVLFCAGILNYLPLASKLIWATGLVLIGCYWWKEKRICLKAYRNCGFFLFLLALLGMVVFLRGKRFLEIDNFVHWASVVRNMVNMNRFPGILDSAISHSSYPLGSAALIYYICTRTGASESLQMLAQGFLILCCIMPLFSYIKGKSVLLGGYLALTTGFLLTFNIPLTELQVDTLLPLAGMAVILVVYRNAWHREENELPIWIMTLAIFWVINIKSAGLMYGLIAWGTLYGANKEKRRQLLTAGVLLLAGISIWNHHCSYVYPDSETSRHAISVAWFAKTIAGKTDAQILDTAKQFLTFAFSRKELVWILGWTGCLTALALCMRKNRRECLKIWVGILGLYMLYAVGTLGMFVFSMPETQGLPGVERYMRTGDIACYYLIAAIAVLLGSQMPRTAMRWATGVVFMGLCVFGWYFQTGEQAGVPLLRCSMELRERLEAPIGEYGVARRRSYLLCVDDADDIGWNQFPCWIWRYNMETGDVKQIKITEESQLAEESRYDYLVIYDQDNPIIQQWVQQHYPDQMGKQVIQHFV